VKDALADIDADRGKSGRRIIHELLLTAGGSSRSIPLADTTTEPLRTR
jgi:hypothetical protein